MNAKQKTPDDPSRLSPEQVMLENMALMRESINTQQQIARILFSAVQLMTLPPFKRDNATVAPDGSLQFKPNSKDNAP